LPRSRGVGARQGTGTGASKADAFVLFVLRALGLVAVIQLAYLAIALVG
jgi:hypothetical protein